MKQNLVLGVNFSDEAATEPVSVAEAKSWLKISVNDDNVLLEDLITTARQQCETYLNISLIERTVTARLQNELSDMELPYGPLVEINSVTDDTDDLEELDVDDYSLRGQLLRTPNNCVVNVEYDAGYPDGIPKIFKTAILNQVAHLYTFRGDDAEHGLASETILKLKPYRRVT